MNTAVRHQTAFSRFYHPSGRVALALLVLLPGTLSVPVLAGAPDQAARWQAARVNPRQTIALDKLVDRFKRTTRVYERIQAMRPNGVPAPVVFGLLYRECDNNLACNPAQGDPLTHRSIHVPRGRIPGLPPPYRFEDAAADAYYAVDHLDTRDWRHVAGALDAIESFNGLGYRPRGVASPYLWSGTSLYARGKFPGDGRFDPLAVDKQLGVAAILKRLRERGVALPFPE